MCNSTRDKDGKTIKKSNLAAHDTSKRRTRYSSIITCALLRRHQLAIKRFYDRLTRLHLAVDLAIIPYKAFVRLTVRECGIYIR